MNIKLTTHDRDNTPQYAAKYYTVGKLGYNRELTPEGFLICRDCGIARTGTMLYGGHELPLQTGPDGLLHVSRGEEDVFRAETLASLIGKTVVNDHPDLDAFPEGGVTAGNWRRLAIGHVQDVRRGEGDEQDLIIADLIITDQSAIDLIQSGKVELSAGYDAAYEQTGPGTARQYNIVYNHVALVDRGRCGPRCSIGDALLPQSTKKRKAKTMKIDRRTADKIRKAFKTNDEEALEEAMSSDNEGGTEKRLERLEDTMKEVCDSVKRIGDSLKARDEAAEEERKKAEDKKARDAAEEEEKKKAEDKARDADKDDDKDDDKAKANDSAGNIRARDSRHLKDDYNDVRATAEIIVPGIQAPTFDAKAEAKLTLDSICKFRRDVLKRGFADAAVSGIIQSVVGRRAFDLETATCDRVADVFNLVGDTIAKANNEATLASASFLPGAVGGVGVHGALKTPEDLNEFYRKHWK